MAHTDLRIVKTKTALQSALLEILEEKNLDDISISEVCRKAKVNRGTFYLHYDHIEGLFAEYFEEITSGLACTYYEPQMNVTIETLKGLKSEKIQIFSHVEKHKEFYRIIFSKKVPMLYYYQLFEEMRRLLVEDISGIVREGIDLQLFCSYQANAIIGMILDWYQNDFSYSVEYLNSQLKQYILNQLNSNVKYQGV